MSLLISADPQPSGGWRQQSKELRVIKCCDGQMAGSQDEGGFHQGKLPGGDCTQDV